MESHCKLVSDDKTVTLQAVNGESIAMYMQYLELGQIFFHGGLNIIALGLIVFTFARLKSEKHKNIVFICFVGLLSMLSIVMFNIIFHTWQILNECIGKF